MHLDILFLVAFSLLEALKHVVSVFERGTYWHFEVRNSHFYKNRKPYTKSVCSMYPSPSLVNTLQQVPDQVIRTNDYVCIVQHSYDHKYCQTNVNLFNNLYDIRQ